MKQLLAFHNSEEIKQRYLDRLEQHYSADEIVHGKYWQDGRGCAVGCTIHSEEHEKYETVLGIPTWLAHVEEQIFETMSRVRAKKFPIQFLSSIPVGFFNWDQLYHDYCVFLLTDIIRYDRKKYPMVKKCVNDVIKLHQNWKNVSSNTWIITRSNIQSIIYTNDIMDYDVLQTMITVRESTRQMDADITTQSSVASLAADIVTSNNDLYLLSAISTSVDEIAKWLLNYLKNQNKPQDILLNTIQTQTQLQGITLSI